MHVPQLINNISRYIAMKKVYREKNINSNAESKKAVMKSKNHATRAKNYAIINC